jgi:hypothetical protein
MRQDRIPPAGKHHKGDSVSVEVLLRRLSFVMDYRGSDATSAQPYAAVETSDADVRSKVALVITLALLSVPLPMSSDAIRYSKTLAHGCCCI